MKILVTGSSGFIGSQLCSALIDAGHIVRAFHRPSSSLRLLEGLPVEHAHGDLTQPETLRAAMQGVEVVFHAGAYMGGGQPGRQYAVTVEGTRNVARAALEVGIRRMVHTSSVAALGVPEDGQRELLDEHHTWNYRPEWYPYGYAKYLAELEIQKAVAAGLDAVIVNPALVVGAGDIYRQSSSIVRLVAARRLPASVEGGINIVSVRDVIDGELAALQRGRKGERYILGGENLTYTAFIHLAAQTAGVQAPGLTLPAGLLRALAGPAGLLERFLDLPVSSDLFRLAGRYFFYDTAKARTELGLADPRPTAGAIREALEWFGVSKQPGGKK
jgi:dihydroflavonol-4-reductase